MVINNTNFTMNEIEGFQFIGETVNNWRQRNVLLYQHPNNDTQIIAVGNSFDQKTTYITQEDKSQWQTAIEYAKRGKILTIN